MSENITITLITALASIIVTCISTYFAVVYNHKKKLEEAKKVFELKELELQKQKETNISLKKENEIVSTGVAIGYYRNFIKRIFSKLDEGNKIEVKLYRKNETDEQVRDDVNRPTYSFNEKQVNVTIVLPKDLTVARLYDAEEYEKGKTKALLIGKNDERHFSFFCDIVNGENLEIYDYPNPFDAVRWFLSLTENSGLTIISGQLVNMGLNQQERHEKEIKNFKSSIENLIKIDLNKSIINRIKFYHKP